MHGKRVLVVTNETVAPLYLDKVVDALTRGNPNVSVESVILPDGEQYKDMVGLMCFELAVVFVGTLENCIRKSLCVQLIGYSYESL